MRQARRLRPGDRVVVVAPGGPIERARLERGADRLRELGLAVECGEALFARERYLAGSDAHRLSLLQSAFDDRGVHAVWAARGGYGTTRLLPKLRLRGVLTEPKLFVGFSDVTALHGALNALGLGSVHGPNVGQLGELTPRAFARLAELVMATPGELPVAAPLEGARQLVPGRAEGLLLGGNLTLLASLVGTPQMPSLAGSILLLEDVGERPYRLDRMLTQLQNAGALLGVRGVALGTFSGCEDPAEVDGVASVFAALANDLEIPAAFGFPIGHVDDNCAVTLGSLVRLDAEAGRLTFLSGLT